MKKLTVILALAGLHTASAFAASAGGAAARRAGEIATEVRGSREAIRPGAATGAKVNGTGATGATAQEASAAAGTTASQGRPAPQAQTGVDSHVTCDADSGISKVSRSEQLAIQAAHGAGLGGNACVTGFKDPAAVSIVAAGEQAGLAEMKSLELSDVSGASRAQLTKVVDAMALAIATKLNIKTEKGEYDIAEAKGRLKDMCNDGCDVTSKAVCEIL